MFKSESKHKPPHNQFFLDLIRPILTHSCQVCWTKLIDNILGETPLVNRVDKMPMERLCNHFHKHSLGFNKYASCKKGVRKASMLCVCHKVGCQLSAENTAATRKSGEQNCQKNLILAGHTDRRFLNKISEPRSTGLEEEGGGEGNQPS